MDRRLRDTASIQVTDATSQGHSEQPGLVREVPARRATFVYWEVQHEQRLRPLCSKIWQHPTTQKLGPRSGYCRSMLDLETRLPPCCRARVGLSTRLMLNGLGGQDHSDPFDGGQVCHCPADGRVVGPQPIGVRDEYRSIAIRQSRKIGRSGLIKITNWIRRTPCVAFGPEPQVARPVVALFRVPLFRRHRLSRGTRIGGHALSLAIPLSQKGEAVTSRA